MGTVTDDGNLAIAAMDLEDQMGNGKWLPLVDMKVVAAHHPEDETKRLVGKAMVMRVAKENVPVERRIAGLREMAAGDFYHAEAREDACAAVRGLLGEQKRWGELALMALDSRNPKKGREGMASAYLACEGMVAAKAMEILRCVDLDEQFRQNEGMKLVDKALFRNDDGMIRRIADEAGAPQFLRVYARSALGRGDGFPKEMGQGPMRDALEKTLKMKR